MKNITPNALRLLNGLRVYILISFHTLRRCWLQFSQYIHVFSRFFFVFCLKMLNIFFHIIFRFVELLKYGDMYIKTEEISACDLCWYSRPCRWRNELSVWCERGNTVARRFGWHDICVLWSDWTGTWHLDLWILKYLQNKNSI